MKRIQQARNLVRSRLPKRPSWRTEDASIPNRRVQSEKLWGVIRKYTGNPIFVDFLASLIEALNVPARDDVALAKALQYYSVNHIKYFREYPERFQSPLRSISWGIGDCDDKTIFIGAGARTFRIPTQVTTIILKHPELDLAHIYPELWLNGQWVPVESTRPYPWGLDPAVVAAKKGILLDKFSIGDKPPKER